MNPDVVADVRKYLNRFQFNVVFDVGANVGQTAIAASESLPDAQIWSFEPVTSTYLLLKDAVAGLPNVRASNLALGADDATALMTAVEGSVNNTLDAVRPGKQPTQEVAIRSGDSFCAENGVRRIDYLKIDTEGHDLAVLRGFHKMLGGHRIGMVEVEAGMNMTNTKHVSFERLKGYLEPIGYFTFGMYEFAYENKRRWFLRRANAVFVSEKVIHRHMRKTPVEA